jgi:hypothetical protein
MESAIPDLPLSLISVFTLQGHISNDPQEGALLAEVERLELTHDAVLEIPGASQFNSLEAR